MRKLSMALLGLLLAFGLAHATLIAVRQPLGHGDYTAVWGLKARAIYFGTSVESVFRVDPAGEFSHPEYPLLWPLVLTGISTLAGRYDELLLTLLPPLLLAFSCLLAFRATRADTPFRLMAAAAVGLLPFFHAPLYLGYAEPLLLVFALGAFAEVERLDASGSARLRFTGLLVLAALTKQEGAVLGLAAALALVLAGRVGLGLRVGATVFFLGVLPWQLVLRAKLPAVPSAFTGAFSFAKLAAAARETLVVGTPAGWFVLGGAVLLLLSPRTLRARAGTGLALALYAAAVFASFGFSRFDAAWHARWSLDRLALLPAAILLVVLAEAAGDAIAGVRPLKPAR